MATMLARQTLIFSFLLIGLASDASAGPDPTGSTRENHLRLRTDQGPVHVWTPAAYDP